MVSSLSEWDEEIHGLTTLGNADEATIGLRKVSVVDFTCDQGFDVFEASELFHEELTVFAGKVGGTTSCDYEVLDLAELVPASVHTTELDHVVSTHESGTVVECSSDGLWLFKHLHDVVMRDSWWKTDFDTFLNNGLDLRLLDLVLQTESQDFFVFDVVKVLGVILEDGGVRRNDLELMLFLFFFFLVITAKFTQGLKRRTLAWSVLLSQALWEPNDHRTCILDDVHSLWIQDGNQNERISSLKNLNGLLDSIENIEALIKENTNPDGGDFCIGLTLRLDVVFLLELLSQTVVVGDDTVVDQRNSLLVVKVRMSVHIGFVTMGRPSSMADTNETIVILPTLKIKSLDAITTKSITGCELVEPELPSRWADRDYAARVITSGLKNVQSINANISSLLLITKISYNAAALVSLLLLLEIVHVSHHTKSSAQHLFSLWCTEHILDLVSRKCLLNHISLHIVFILFVVFY